jgi:hypothetical protein
MKCIPSHWWLSGVGKARAAEDVFLFTQVTGGRAATFRKLLRIGPFGFCVIRYAPDPQYLCDGIAVGDQGQPYAECGRRESHPAHPLDLARMDTTRSLSDGAP